MRLLWDCPWRNRDRCLYELCPAESSVQFVKD